MKRNFLLGFIVLCLLCSCHQRYWFRSKVRVDSDSVERDKSYNIAW